MSNKSVVIVPGFWGDPASFSQVTDGLKQRGYHAVVVELPSWGCEPPNKTLLDDAQAVREEVLKMVDAGYEITVTMHSAGGFIAPEALKGLLAPELRSSGRPGGVTALVYITAPCMSVGEMAPPAPWFEYKVSWSQASRSQASHATTDAWPTRAIICGRKILVKHCTVTSLTKRLIDGLSV